MRPVFCSVNHPYSGPTPIHSRFEERDAECRITKRNASIDTTLKKECEPFDQAMLHGVEMVKTDSLKGSATVDDTANDTRLVNKIEYRKREAAHNAMGIIIQRYFMDDFEKWLIVDFKKKEDKTDASFANHPHYGTDRLIKEWKIMVFLARNIFDTKKTHQDPHGQRWEIDDDLSAIFNGFKAVNRGMNWLTLLDLWGLDMNISMFNRMVGSAYFERLCQYNDARKIIGDPNMIGAKDWCNLYGVFTDQMPPLPKNIIEILKSDCGINAGKKVKDTHRLVLIPKCINKNGQTMTLTVDRYSHPTDGLICDVRTPYQDHSKIYQYTHRLEGESKGVESSWAQKSIRQTMWALMYVGDTRKDNGVLKGSRNKTWQQQVMHLHDVNQHMKQLINTNALVTSDEENPDKLYRIASPLELMILAMGFYNKTGTKILTLGDPDKANSYARTASKWQRWMAGDHIGVGDFDSDGLSAHYSEESIRCKSGGLGVLRIL